MERNINIRKVESEDAKILAYIQTESWKNAFSTILSKEDLEKYTDMDEAVKMYNKILGNDFANGFILSLDDKPHCIAYWSKSRNNEMKDYSEIICIHSLCNNWGRGYGSIMIEYILKEIKEAGFSKVMLWVFEENNRARRFYEKHGFNLTEKTKEFSGCREVMYYRDV